MTELKSASLAVSKQFFAASVFAGLIAVALAPSVSAQTKPAQAPAMSENPNAGPGGNAPAVPNGAGATGGQAAPPPPPEQNVILPSASGHINSAAPTMNRSCEVASPDRAGTASTDSKNDPCRKEAAEADKQNAPVPSK